MKTGDEGKSPQVRATGQLPGGWLRSAIDLALSTQPRRRMRLVNTAGALMLVSISMAVLAYLARADVAAARPVAVLAVVSIGGFVLAWVAIRSGWTERFEDPGLTLLQVLYAVCCCAAGYVIAGPARGAVFPVLMVATMSGVFGLAPRRIWYAIAFSIVVFGAVMALAEHFDPHAFPAPIEVAHFAVIAAALAMTAAIAARLARMRERAHRDGLTGLLTRQPMRDSIDAERQRCARSGASFSIALIDLDHFKRINDTYGHATGDEVLRTFSREASRTIRSSDVLARWGGEEFLLMMPDTQLKSAVRAVERLRDRICGDPIPLRAGVVLRVTMSAGVAEHASDDAIDITLERADASLYQSKRSGRNRVIGA